jgi:hypothetical protein
MRLNKRAKFICHMVVLMGIMLAVSIAIKMRFYAQVTIWGLFAYIIAKEVIDYLREARFRRRCQRWPITFIFSRSKIKGDITMFQLHTDEVLPFKLGKPVDSTGADAEVEEGSLVITSSDPTVFTIEQDPDFPDDPYAGIIVSQGEGTATLHAKADADLGEGVTEITLEVEGQVLAAGAVGFAPWSFGTPRKKPATGENQG